MSAISQSELNETPRFTSSLQVSSRRSESQCIHTLYPSVQSFVDNVLWTLNRNRCFDETNFEENAAAFSNSFDSHRLCTLCKHTILSTLPLGDFLWNHDADFSKISIYLRLYASLLDHPKIPKILVKECRRSMDVYIDGESTGRKEGFESLCQLLLNLTISLVWRAGYDSEPEAYLRLTELIVMSTKKVRVDGFL